MKNRIIEEDLVLLNALGLEEDKISLKDEDIELVINCMMITLRKCVSSETIIFIHLRQYK